MSDHARDRGPWAQGEVCGALGAKGMQGAQGAQMRSVDGYTGYTVNTVRTWYTLLAAWWPASWAQYHSMEANTSQQGNNIAETKCEQQTNTTNENEHDGVGKIMFSGGGREGLVSQPAASSQPANQQPQQVSQPATSRPAPASQPASRQPASQPASLTEGMHE